MRKLFFAVCILGITITAAFAQTIERERDRAPLLVVASESRQEADKVQLTGNVTLRLSDGTSITAGDALINPTTRQIELRGAVRVSLPPDVKLIAPTK